MEKDKKRNEEEKTWKRNIAGKRIKKFNVNQFFATNNDGKLWNQLLFMKID